jgi:hypothetical protein
MSGQIFISYRPDDASSAARRLYDRLSAHCAQNQIFMDADTDPGSDFVEAIEKNAGTCDVLIAVIGKRWLSAADEAGKRRLDNPEDFVRTEIGTALERGIRVIPVLVDGALMPRSDELPDELKPLARRRAISVNSGRFGDDDSEPLIGAVTRALKTARTQEQRQREEQERVDAERRERDETERLELARRQRVSAPTKAEPPRPIPVRFPTRWSQRALETAEADPPAAEAHPVAERLPATRKKSWRSPVMIGIGAAVFLLSLTLLFKARRPLSVSVGERPLPTPPPAAVTAAASTAPSPMLSVSQAAPSPTAAVSQASLSPMPSASEASLSPAPALSEILPNPTASVSDVLLSRIPAGADWLAEAKRYLDAKDYPTALPLLQKAAEAGDAEAMINLDSLYDKGWGGPQDYAQARQWYQKAADAGNADGMYKLGWLYRKG